MKYNRGETLDILSKHFPDISFKYKKIIEDDEEIYNLQISKYGDQVFQEPLKTSINFRELFVDYNIKDLIRIVSDNIIIKKNYGEIK